MTPPSFTSPEKPAAPVLFFVVNITLLVANLGSGTGAHLGAARLLYGMGRSDALPKAFFGAIEPKHHIPRNNVLLVGVVAVVGGLSLTLSARRGDAELRRVHRVHGRQPRRVRDTGFAATTAASPT